MRISDWSSDVCSSDLAATRRPAEAVAAIGGGFEAVEIAKIIALAASPMTAAILVETHCLIVAFGSSTSILPAPCAGRRTQFTMSKDRSEEHTSELQSLMRISYAVFCLKQKQISPYRTKIKQNSITNTK